ncbi:type II secretion system F family protein [[Clostridium] polysaccharolyticum]|uniref:Type IV pilus assembly protein PilC n=1 Tax=[Clostridium] polysaccharolyticum TaxID=29364 RepID=A0A1H9ZQY3_9FIRM|nr:type II secretion system F family protein [[Clostridium] polysaccharolyticum]SES84208.1 type IV pilus assembly protein PilC [[Clostridium] polysaccharolyticum]
MPIFDYEGIDQNGKMKRGSLEGNDEDAIMASLKLQGLTPVSVNKQTMFSKDLDIAIGKRVSSKELAIFCRQFASIINAGVTIINALEMLYEQSENKYMTKAIREVQTAVEKGESLADGMRSQPKVFPEILVNMVEAGEASGSLEVALNRMTTHFEKSDTLRSTVKNAMIYPIMVILVSVAVVIIMMVKVVPSFMDMFDDIDGELPAITKMVMNISNFIVHNGILLACIIVLLVVLFVLYRNSDKGRYQLSAFLLKVPLFGKLVQKSASATFTRTLSTLLASGISLIDAVEITTRVVDNEIFKEALKQAKDEVERGVALSEPLEACGQFPPMVFRMIRIGEETGNMESMLDKVADFYEEDVQNTTKALTTIMEPIIIIVLAIIVGTIMLAVMSPMFALYNSIGNAV